MTTDTLLLILTGLCAFLAAAVVWLVLEMRLLKIQTSENLRRDEQDEMIEAILTGVRSERQEVQQAVLNVERGVSQTLAGLTGYELTRGVLCAMRRPPLPAVEQVCAGARRVAVLENVMNPTNLGAIFRSAAALGIDAVLLTQACSDPLYRRAIRVSMGTVFQVPWTYLPEGWPQTLRALGFTTAAMALCDASLPIYAPQLKRADRLAVVLGTEGDGLAESTIAACDCTVRIPMTHGVDSLNVAAASAVAFYQLALLAGLSEMED